MVANSKEIEICFCVVIASIHQQECVASNVCGISVVSDCMILIGTQVLQVDEYNGFLR